MIIHTWRYADDCGNVSGFCTTRYTIVDDVAPVITSCPKDFTTNTCDPSVIAPNPGAVTGTDNCDTNLDVLVIATNTSGNAGSCDDNNPYIITYVYVVVDDCGNQSAPCEQNIRLVDTTPPVLTCPKNIIIVEGCSAADVNVSKHCRVGYRLR